ncbi:hypothetical protein TNCV_4007801 [Trichonephila clavipes]|nr:hypothetical protein TNCV_4007801 [Trichonephila clavipes]
MARSRLAGKSVGCTWNSLRSRRFLPAATYIRTMRSLTEETGVSNSKQSQLTRLRTSLTCTSLSTESEFSSNKWLAIETSLCKMPYPTQSSMITWKKTILIMGCGLGLSPICNVWNDLRRAMAHHRPPLRTKKELKSLL